jgi:hypothetical protein
VSGPPPPPPAPPPGAAPPPPPLPWVFLHQALMARNSVPALPPIPCLTYIRDPVDRLVSYYYFQYRAGNRYMPVAPGVHLQSAVPEVALRALVTLDPVRRHFGLVGGEAPAVAPSVSLPPHSLQLPCASLRLLLAWLRPAAGGARSLCGTASFPAPTPRPPNLPHPQVPLLAQFGSLQGEEFASGNATAMERARARALLSLDRCVVANSDDMAASEVLVAHFLPWVSQLLAADTVPHHNTRASQRHPGITVDGQVGCCPKPLRPPPPHTHTHIQAPHPAARAGQLAPRPPVCPVSTRAHMHGCAASLPLSPQVVPEAALQLPLPPATQRAIEESSWFRDEVALYRYALQLHHHQLRHVGAAQQLLPAL